MHTLEDSDRELTELEIRDVIERAEVTTPVLAYKVAGNRIELHLLGGPIAYVEADWFLTQETAENLLDELEAMTYEALYKLAQKLKIRGRSSMNSGTLIEEIRGVVGRG